MDGFGNFALGVHDGRHGAGYAGDPNGGFGYHMANYATNGGYRGGILGYGASYLLNQHGHDGAAMMFRHHGLARMAGNEFGRRFHPFGHRHHQE